MKRILSLFLILLLYATSILGEDPYTQRSHDYYEEIHFEFINNKIIIPVVINEKNYRFLFDTGAPNVISKELNEIITTKSLNTVKASDAARNSNKLNIVSIPGIILGKTTFKDTKTLVYNLTWTSQNQTGKYSIFVLWTY